VIGIYHSTIGLYSETGSDSGHMCLYAKPTVMYNITVGLKRKTNTVALYHCRFVIKTDSDRPAKAAAAPSGAGRGIILA